MRTDAKSILGRALVLGLRVMNSSFFTVVFLQPFVPLPLLFSFFVLYTMVLHPFLHPRVGQVLGVFFSCFPCLFLNLPFLAVRLFVHYSGITSTLMRPES